MRLTDLRISSKYPIIVVGLSLLSAAVTGGIAYTKSAAELTSAAEAKLVALRDSRMVALESYLDTIRQDLVLLASSGSVKNALGAFNVAWTELGGDGRDRLQQHYIENNPHPLGAKDRLDQAPDGSRYSAAHGQYHPWFRRFLVERGYYDLFLIAPNGDLVYTVFKEPDFATNLATGAWAGSGLGRVFREIAENPREGQVAFADFEPYEPSRGAPASFIAAPVFDDALGFQGVLALQMPVGRLNQLMQVSAGMGETGETYIVGQDQMMRSDSRFSAESTILKTRVDSDATVRALSGETGLDTVADYRGVSVYSAFSSIEFLGIRWAVLSEVDEAEILAPIRRARDFMIIAAGIVAVVVSLVGFYIAQGLSRPISGMGRVMRQLAAGDFEVAIPAAGRKDEIGEMAVALAVLRENAIERRAGEVMLRDSEEKFRSIINSASDAMVSADHEGRIISWNQGAERIFGYDDTEIIGRPVSRLIPNHYVDAHEDGMARAASGGPLKSAGQALEVSAVRKDGTEFPAELTLSRWTSQGESRFTGIIRDITERKEADERTRRAHEQTMAILAESPFGVTVTDSETGRVVFANQQSAKLFRMGEDQLRDTAATDFYADPKQRAQLAVAFDFQGAIRDQEVRMKRGDGSEFWDLLSLTSFDYEGRRCLLGWHHDMTERKNAAAQMARQAQIMTDVLNNIAQGVVKYDGEQTIVVSNQNYQDMLQLPDDLVGEGKLLRGIVRHLAERGDYGEGDLETLTGRRMRTLSSGVASRTEVSIGGAKIYDTLVQPTEDGGAVITYTDITERKQAEQAVRESEQNMRRILENSPVGVVIVSKSDYQRRYVNPRFLEMFGAESEEQLLAASQADSYADPAEFERTRAAFASDEPTVTVEVQRKRLDGSLWWALMTRTEVNYSGEDVHLNWHIDITERKHAERAAQESERNMRGILENSPIGVAIVSYTELKRRYINARFVEMFGAESKDDLLEANMADSYVDPADLDDLRAAFESDAPIVSGEALRRRLDGSLWWSYMVRTKVKYFGEDVFLIWLIDITERKQAQEEIERRQAMLDAVLDNMSDGIFAMDKDLKVTMYNHRWPKLVGYRRDDLHEGQDMHSIVHYIAEQGFYGPGDIDELVEARLAAFRSPDYIEREITTHEDKVVHLRKTSLAEGGAVVVLSDITQRKRAEESLAKAISLINESIQYASRIQRSVLPDPAQLKTFFKDQFVIWEPKETVGGDIYHIRNWGHRTLLLVGDCTGHGVPGAFMTLIVTGALDQAMNEVAAGDPAALLGRMNQLVKYVLGQDTGDGESDDGFECGACVIDDVAGEIVYAGARFELWAVNGDDVSEFKGDKVGIGYRRTAGDQTFTNRTIPMDTSGRFYLFSDGAVDQVGGEKHRSFGKRRLRALILDCQNLSMSDQAARILAGFNAYQGDEERRDDLTIFGFQPLDAS